jgi:hypothetical protein
MKGNVASAGANRPHARAGAKMEFTTQGECPPSRTDLRPSISQLMLHLACHLPRNSTGSDTSRPQLHQQRQRRWRLSRIGALESGQGSRNGTPASLQSAANAARSSLSNSSQNAAASSPLAAHSSEARGSPVAPPACVGRGVPGNQDG